MAGGKDSFILYTKYIHVVRKLSDEMAGKLYKMILEYVNDNNPQTDDFTLELIFEPIKQDLKEDLKKWELVCERNRENGKNGGRPRLKPKKPSGLNNNPDNPSEPKKPKRTRYDSDSDMSIDNDIKEDIYILPKFNFKNSLLKIGVSEQVASDWIKVRKDKKASNTETAFNSIKNQIDLSELSANECIKIAVERSWQGFKAEWLINDIKNDKENAGVYKITKGR